MIGQLLDRHLPGLSQGGVALPGIMNNRTGEDAHGSCRSDHAAAPVSKPVAIAGHRHGGPRLDVIGSDEITDPRVMHIENQETWRLPRKTVVKLIANTKFHIALTDR